MNQNLSSRAAWIGRVEAVMRGSSLGRAACIEVVSTHRRDHLLAVATGSHGQRWFIKAFDLSAEKTFRSEVSLYRAFDGDGVAPTLRFIDEATQVIATDFVEGGRLGDLPAGEVRGIMRALPALHVKLCGRPIGHDHRVTLEDFADEWRDVAGLPEAEGLPDASTVTSILASLPRYAVHGDFQPSNVVIGIDGPLAVDFESYGMGLPGMDVARMTYNPQLPLDDLEREGLSREWIDRLEFHGYGSLTPRAFAACTVAWAVSCSAYFRGVLASDTSAAQHTPEAVPLSSSPLVLAAKMWNRAV